MGEQVLSHGETYTCSTSLPTNPLANFVLSDVYRELALDAYAQIETASTVMSELATPATNAPIIWLFTFIRNGSAVIASWLSAGYDKYPMKPSVKPANQMPINAKYRPILIEKSLLRFSIYPS